MSSDEVAEEAVAVPHGDLSPETLRSLVEAFVLREGTDYGEQERLLEQKVHDVIRQLQRGEAQILFDPVSQSVNIVTANPKNAAPRRS
jgi:uncharacterized protein